MPRSEVGIWVQLLAIYGYGWNMVSAFSNRTGIIRRSAPRYFLVCGLAQVKCLSQGSPLKHDGRRKTTKRKKTSKRVFKGFLYGTSGGRNSKGSSPGPPGRKKKIKTGTYHWEKHIAYLMHICNVRSQVFFPGVWVCLRDFIFYFFFGSLERETFTVGKHLALRNPSNMGKFSRNTVGKPGPLRRGKRKHLWYRRRVETGTYHWEGRKPFIQTFE